MPEEYDKEIPISGPLFTLTTEPSILICKNTLRHSGLPVPPSISRSHATSAYENDITVFISKTERFPNLFQNFTAYGALSGATFKCTEVNLTFRGPKKKQNRPPSRI
jgi:hypothetical protein